MYLADQAVRGTLRVAAARSGSWLQYRHQLLGPHPRPER